MKHRIAEPVYPWHVLEIEDESVPFCKRVGKGKVEFNACLYGVRNFIARLKHIGKGLIDTRTVEAARLFTSVTCENVVFTSTGPRIPSFRKTTLACKHGVGFMSRKIKEKLAK